MWQGTVKPSLVLLRKHHYPKYLLCAMYYKLNSEDWIKERSIEDGIGNDTKIRINMSLCLLNWNMFQKLFETMDREICMCTEKRESQVLDLKVRCRYRSWLSISSSHHSSPRKEHSILHQEQSGSPRIPTGVVSCCMELLKNEWKGSPCLSFLSGRPLSSMT